MNLSLEQMMELSDEDRSKLFKHLKNLRHTAKQGGYAAQYGAGPKRLALTANVSEKKAKDIHESYWKRNWAWKEVASQQKIKTVRGQMWLYNPISKFWYSLRYEKDIGSTLVQGSASYVFDRWVARFRETRSQLTAQYHDEVVLCVKLGNREKCTKLLKDSINWLNSQLKLNRELDIETKYGQNYGEIH